MSKRQPHVYRIELRDDETGEILEMDVIDMCIEDAITSILVDLNTCGLISRRFRVMRYERLDEEE